MVTPGSLDHLLAAADRMPLTNLLSAVTGDSTKELEQAAAGPLAALLCRAVVRQDTPDDLVIALLRGLERQSSLLALLDATDELLGSDSVVAAFGSQLHASFLTGHAAALCSRPIVASSFAEGALRLAIGGTGNPLRTLVALTPSDVDALDPDYAERLPRLIGAALDRWGLEPSVGEALRETLSNLLCIPVAAADAAYESGIDRLRQIASADPNPLPSLVAARKQFAHAAAAEEGRFDAALYGAGVDAVMAFFRGDIGSLRTARGTVSTALGAWSAGLRRSHVPAWRRPRMEAACAWARLVAILDRAAYESTQPVWDNAWPALDAILDAYLLERSVVPIPGALDEHGFAHLIRPAIESSLGRRETLLAQLRIVATQTEPGGRHSLLLGNLDQLADGSQPGEYLADESERVRLLGLAPTLLTELGAADAASIAKLLDDDRLRLVEGIAYNSAVRRAALREPVTARIIDRITADLQPCRAYAGTLRHSFDALVEETVMFLATRHDLQRSAAVNYLHPSSPPPLEARLQDDFADWLRRGPLVGRIDVEVPNVATGRADIKVGFGASRFFIEVKRELQDGFSEALERSYLAQAADYSGTSAQLGMLLVLDLTAHPDGVRHLDECAWVTRHRPAGSTVDRYVLVAVVTGNRSTPSAYSRIAHTRGGPRVRGGPR
ncbi:hypothetical protein ACIA8K_38900 [Catenuloplanes sp. NPDC051500]|uniref:hypothetical protein n=1 Tax=Catenuloplanes sp. NPDC051500 TaxID=3363959 RepID=UPI0037948A84